MLFSALRHCPVVGIEEAADLGRVEAVGLAPAGAAVAHLRVSGAGRHPRLVPWSAVHAAGPDAVLVRAAEVADDGEEEAPGQHEALGTRVLTDLGNEHGTVEDVAFDPATGRIHTLYTTLGAVPGERVMGLGDYALVVRVAQGVRGA
ncbi:hypothetical protein [Streptomyces sp. NPDC049555]|uniref:PRC-barrel domain-containing protein n=1 Tax=unclassified Streptomyces TaxID=2593676 RepID=UPI00343408BB